jgi:hypothetical protein
MDEEHRTRRGVVLYKNNPFMVGGMVKTKTRKITNRRGDMMVVGNTGEIVSPVPGFWQAQEVDASKFVKLYVNGVKAFKELTNAGTKVFEVLYLEVQKNISQDRVYLSHSIVDQDANPMSAATYKRGMAELISKEFLAPTNTQSWYWLNPDFMWNGDRLAFVREYRKKGGTFSDPRQQTLPLEEVGPAQ